MNERLCKEVRFFVYSRYIENPAIMTEHGTKPSKMGMPKSYIIKQNPVTYSWQKQRYKFDIRWYCGIRYSTNEKSMV